MTKKKAVSLHEDLADSILKDFFEKNSDVDLEAEITWQTDLGFRVIMSSYSTAIARAGHATSLTTALTRLVERTIPKVEEYRTDKARIQAAYEAAIDDDDD